MCFLGTYILFAITHLKILSSHCVSLRHGQLTNTLSHSAYVTQHVFLFFLVEALCHKPLGSHSSLEHCTYVTAKCGKNLAKKLKRFFGVGISSVWFARK